MVARAPVETTPGDYVTLDVDVPAGLVEDGQVTLQIESPYLPSIRGGGRSGEPDDYREVGVAVARVMVRHPATTPTSSCSSAGRRSWGVACTGCRTNGRWAILDTYSVICPISQFTDDWLWRYWGKRGDPLPPVDVEQFAPHARTAPDHPRRGAVFPGQPRQASRRHDPHLSPAGA